MLHNMFASCVKHVWCCLVLVMCFDNLNREKFLLVELLQRSVGWKMVKSVVVNRVF